MIKRTRKRFKWGLIAISAITSLAGVFSGVHSVLIINTLLFWLYIILDKYKPLTKSSDVYDLYKDEE